MEDQYIVKLAVDAYKNKVQNFSVDESMKVLRKALIDANGGATEIKLKNIRDGKCNGLFTIVEEILDQTVLDNLTGNEFFQELVEYRNIALGDTNKFIAKDKSLFVVSDMASGSQSLRRQRLNVGQEVEVKPTPHGVRIYEELNRVLSGRIDFTDLIDTVTKSEMAQKWNDMYLAFKGFTETQTPNILPVSGSYDEDELFLLISHIEAETSDKVTILGSKAALRQIKSAVPSEQAKSDLYNIGYYGKFYGINMVSMKQSHKPGTKDFLLDDNIVFVVPGGEKPIKFVTAGESYLSMPDPGTKADLTQEFLHIDQYGIGVIANQDYGSYKLATQ